MLNILCCWIFHSAMQCNFISFTDKYEKIESTRRTAVSRGKRKGKCSIFWKEFCMKLSNFWIQILLIVSITHPTEIHKFAEFFAQAFQGGWLSSGIECCPSQIIGHKSTDFQPVFHLDLFYSSISAKSIIKITC